MAILDNFWWFFFPLYRMSRWLSPTSFWSYLFCQHPTYFSPLDLWSQNESCTCQGKIYEKKGEDTRKKGSSYFWRDEHSVLKLPKNVNFFVSLFELSQHIVVKWDFLRWFSNTMHEVDLLYEDIAAKNIIKIEIQRFFFSLFYEKTFLSKYLLL